MNKGIFIKQLDDVLDNYDIIKSKAVYEDLSGNTTIEEIAAVITKAKAAIMRITGINSEYYKETETILKETNTFEGLKLRHIIGIVSALKSDLENDYLKALSDIIQSEVFTDYIDMAEYLLKEGYKDPAAVLIGSTLEVHLRELCISNGIEIKTKNNRDEFISKKAGLMNSDLAKAGVYTSAYQKQITAWLGLRNAAAHGNYSEYKTEEISLMLQGVRQFILIPK